MIVVETKERPQLPEASTELDGFANLLVIDSLLIESGPLRCAVAFAKGLVGSCALLALTGFEWGLHNGFAITMTFFLSLSLAIMESMEQTLAGARQLDSALKLKASLQSINPAYAAIIPLLVLLATVNFQTLIIAVSNLAEVVGIACGVPLLLFGVIKIVQKSTVGRAHFYVGTASAFGGIALSVLVNFCFSSVSDLSVFSASTYFSDAIIAIYAPDVVLHVEDH